MLWLTIPENKYLRHSVNNLHVSQYYVIFFGIVSMNCILTLLLEELISHLLSINRVLHFLLDFQITQKEEA
jgi:hypothetical protein